MSRRPPLLLAVALAAALAAPAGAQGPAAFSRMGMGARSLAVPSQIADLSGTASPYLNPALAPFQLGQTLELSAGQLTFDRQWQAVQVGAPLRPRAGVAGGVVYGGVDGIDGRDASGAPTQTLSTDEYAFFVAFGARLTERLAGGVGMRIYRSSVLDGTRAPTALGVSFGLAAKLSDRLSLGATADDLFAQYEWNAGAGGATDRFPQRVALGGAYAVGPAEGAGRGVVSAEVQWTVQTAEVTTSTGLDVIGTDISEGRETTDVRLASAHGRVGAEVWLAEPFALRLGVDRLGADLGAARPALGFAVRRVFGDLDVQFDYTAVLEPYASGVMQMGTLRLRL